MPLCRHNRQHSPCDGSDPGRQAEVSLGLAKVSSRYCAPGLCVPHICSRVLMVVTLRSELTDTSLSLKWVFVGCLQL